MNKLTIEYVQVVKVGNRAYLWVNLSTETETRQCCYSRYSGTWCHEDGDCEPQMTTALRDLFHGKKGDKALTKCYKSGEIITLAV